MATPLTTADHERIADAIRQAEAATSGEIYCVVARSSDDYFYPAAYHLTLAFAFVSGIAAFVIDGWWATLGLSQFMAAVLLSFCTAFFLLGMMPGLRIYFVPRRLRYRQAHENAVKQFLARNVHRTGARTGVLIFVSLAERYATVIADSGIDEKVPQSAWNEIVGHLIAHARRDELTEGFIAAIAGAGVLLATNFPVGAGDRNELDDHLVEI